MKESEIAQAYKKYLWPKCSRTQFYLNIKKWMSILEAIKPIPHEQRYKRKIKSKRFSEELERYYKQEWKKVDRWRFYQRLYQGRSKEEAIKKWELQPHKNIIKKESKQLYQRPITPIYKKQEESDIRITYSTEEAKVFRREYERMINELQSKYDECEDITEAREIRQRLEKIRKEYLIFNLYNKYE